MELYFNPNDEKSISVNIPSRTILTYEYIGVGDALYVEYKGTKGWLIIDDSSRDPISAIREEVKDRRVFILTDNVYVYSKPFDLTSKTSVNLEKGIELSIVYDVYDGGYYGEPVWYYVNYNGQKVWIAGNADDKVKDILEQSKFYDTKSKVNINSNNPNYKKELNSLPNFNSDVVGSVGNNDDVGIRYRYYINEDEEWYYIVKEDGTAGWIENFYVEPVKENEKEPDGEYVDLTSENNIENQKTTNILESNTVRVVLLIVCIVLVFAVVVFLVKRTKIKEK